MSEQKELSVDKKDADKKDDRTSSSSRIFKAKKYLASKTAGSKAGRKAVEHFLGDAGTQLINCMETVAAKEIGSAPKAKELIETILKLAFKGKLLHDEQLLPQQERDSFVEPINTLAVMFFKKLQYCQGLRQDDPADVTVINLRFAQLQELICGFLKKHVKPSTVEKAAGVFQYFGGLKFLEFFLHSDVCRKDRQLFFKCLLVVMKSVIPEEDLVPPVTPCKTPGCQDPSCHPDGAAFMGSVYCIKHHTEYFAQFSKPSILHCLQGRKHEAFSQWSAKAIPENSINFIISVTNFSNAKRTALVIFAEELYKKYIAENSKYCVKLNKPTVAEIEARLKAPGDLEAHRTIFNDAKMEVVAQLDPIFLKEFVPSGGWDSFLAANRLPADYEQ